MDNPFPIVAMLGRRLERERTGWRDMKALVLLVAQSGPEETAWPAASDLAAVLGLDEDQQENVYRNAYGHPPAGERPGTTTAAEGHPYANRSDRTVEAVLPRHRDDLTGHQGGAWGRDRSGVGDQRSADPVHGVPAYPGFR